MRENSWTGPANSRSYGEEKTKGPTLVGNVVFISVSDFVGPIRKEGSRKSW